LKSSPPLTSGGNPFSRCLRSTSSIRVGIGTRCASPSCVIVFLRRSPRTKEFPRPQPQLITRVIYLPAARSPSSCSAASLRCSVTPVKVVLDALEEA
jgi:hypothetical protein